MLYLSKSIKNVFLYNYVNEYRNASYLAIVNGDRISKNVGKHCDNNSIIIKISIFVVPS